MDDFEEGAEIVRVYLAATLGEAQQVERVLEEAGLEFAVEVEEFASRTALFSGGVRRGAGFWVREVLVDGAADALERAGCVAGLVDRG
jgi:hypothetical protein